MNKITPRHSRTALAVALPLALVFAAGCTQDANRDTMATAPEQTQPAMQGTTATDPYADTRDTTGMARDTDPWAEPRTDGAMGTDARMGTRSDQPVNDTWITTKVKSSLLANTDVAGLDIRVETVNGVVTLSGEVDEQRQIDEATRIAREIEGVTDVRTVALTTNPAGAARTN